MGGHVASRSSRRTSTISPEVETPFSMSHTVSGRPFMVQRNGLAMVWLK